MESLPLFWWKKPWFKWLQHVQWTSHVQWFKWTSLLRSPEKPAKRFESQLQRLEGALQRPQQRAGEGRLEAAGFKPCAGSAGNPKMRKSMSETNKTENIPHNKQNKYIQCASVVHLLKQSYIWSRVRKSPPPCGVVWGVV